MMSLKPADGMSSATFFAPGYPETLQPGRYGNFVAWDNMYGPVIQGLAFLYGYADHRIALPNFIDDILAGYHLTKYGVFAI